MTKTKASFRSWPRKKLKQKKCVRGSIRVVKPKRRKDVRILVCCPPGKWKKGRCVVGMKPHVEYKKSGFRRRR